MEELKNIDDQSNNMNAKDLNEEREINSRDSNENNILIEEEGSVSDEPISSKVHNEILSPITEQQSHAIINKQSTQIAKLPQPQSFPIFLPLENPQNNLNPQISKPQINGKKCYKIYSVVRYLRIFLIFLMILEIMSLPLLAITVAMLRALKVLNKTCMILYCVFMFLRVCGGIVLMIIVPVPILIIIVAILVFF